MKKIKSKTKTMVQYSDEQKKILQKIDLIKAIYLFGLLILCILSIAFLRLPFWVYLLAVVISFLISPFIKLVTGFKKKGSVINAKSD